MWCWSFFLSRLWPNSDGKWSESTAEKGLQIVEYSTWVEINTSIQITLDVLKLRDIQVQKIKMGNLKMEILKRIKVEKNEEKYRGYLMLTPNSCHLFVENLAGFRIAIGGGQSRGYFCRVQRPRECKSSCFCRLDLSFGNFFQISRWKDAFFSMCQIYLAYII